MEEPALDDLYDIPDTSSYILRHHYKRVALQFPDQLLKVSVRICFALKNELRRQSQGSIDVQLYVLADTTYGSCCADEIAAAHVNAECIVHYGHTCLSQMSKLPVWYVFGRAMMDVADAVQQLQNFWSTCTKKMLVAFDLEYAHMVPNIKQKFLQSKEHAAVDHSNMIFADVPIREMLPCTYTGGATGSRMDTQCVPEEEEHRKSCAQREGNVEETKEYPCAIYNFGGLQWTLPGDCKMEDVVLFWLGHEGPALTNIMLTFRASTVVLYDPGKKCLVKDVANQSKFLMRRYYLVERAKDAKMVGIVVGTLGVAGYGEMVHVIKDLVQRAGKKSYTLAMGRPSPAKLANFPECDVFVLVACAQTALLDSKDYLAPVITPFEAITAWKRGSQWTGAYSLDFRSLKEYYESEFEASDEKRGPWFSFIKGSYIEDEESNNKADYLKEASKALTLAREPEQALDHTCTCTHMLTPKNLTDYLKEASKALTLAREAEQALQLQTKGSSEMSTRPDASSGVEYFVSRTFQGLKVDAEDRAPQQHVVGRKGRASAYNDEPAK